MASSSGPLPLEMPPNTIVSKGLKHDSEEGGDGGGVSFYCKLRLHLSIASIVHIILYAKVSISLLQITCF